ncbi:DNA integrity scanning diadenylate cyclase DisA [Psychrilyobacter sp.]|uniref:DNA integrity scanning diadenylate cyclase DisA n=1 Tax=Psychrilyobacter sp. TaxID=2586924 RepID=UPI003015D095
MEHNLKKIFSQVTPGTVFREGLDNILDAGTGALVVLDANDTLGDLIDGGFELNCRFTPQRLHELSKMDGAIILDGTASKIKYANVHLQPGKLFKTNESGTRHRTAQRVARQTDNLVIAISERRNRITLYKGDFRYKVKNLADIMIEASQAMKTFERYKHVLDRALQNITLLEFDRMVTLSEVVTVLQRFEMLIRIRAEVEHSIIELGSEGKFLEIQLEELFKGVLKEEENFIRDYINLGEDEFGSAQVKERLLGLGDLELLETENIAGALGYGRSAATFDMELDTKGYRILNKITRITRKDTEKIISKYAILSKILELTEEELVEMRGISMFKARSIKNGIKRLKMTAEWEK